MLKKIIHISSPMHLSIRLSQLVLYDKIKKEEEIRPFSDIGFLIVDSFQTTLTQAVIQAACSHNTALVFCGKDHHPQAMLFRLEGHNTQTQTFNAQIEASQPLKKKLWKQTVKSKIINQAALLKYQGLEDEPLRYSAKKVKSGDSENREAQAARVYWPALFGEDFLRRRDGKPPNNMLNYGYMVLRAAMARAISGSGLLPGLGIHHKNKYNAYCLADDLMEPYRPYVDLAVLEYLENQLPPESLDKAEKALMLKVLYSDVIIGKKKRPLMLALSESTASLARCFLGEDTKISYPKL
ncbi:MAG: type II CRISPR-associated endonuclease Cas1 [Balneolales bacterium]|nr:type II CRISPR-associated endonuclease Cas1 [Balneolales bacterium]